MENQKEFGFFIPKPKLLEGSLFGLSIFVLLALAGNVWADAYSDAVLADSPVAYWRFSETDDSGAIVNSGSASTSLDATAYNGVYLTYPGPQGTGFDAGNSSSAYAAGPNPPQYIEIVDPGTSSDLDFGAGDAMTLETWFYLPEILPSNSVNYLLGKGRVSDTTATDQSYSLRFSPTGEFSMLFRTSDDAGWGKWSAPMGTSVLGSWHHLVFSHTWGMDAPGTGTTTAVYLDGQDVTGQGGWNEVSGVPAQWFSPLVTDEPLWIGASLNSNTAATTGWIDEVAIYRSALTAQQALDHYQAAGYDGGSPLPTPINGLQNGDFESTEETFGSPWNDFGENFPAVEHVGLSATGLAPGTKAAYVTETIHASMSQEIAAEASTWELGFLFAAEQPESSRTLQFTVNHTDNPDNNMILMRIDPSGNLQAYNPASSWTTLPGCDGIIDFSVDADADGSLDDAGDTLNVYSLKIVGDYSETPSYDVYLSDANTGNLTLLGDDLDWFIGTAPEAGDTITRLQFCQYQTPETGASYIVDEVYFQSGDSPEPVAGDANGDGKVDGSDVTILAGNWQAGVGDPDPLTVTWEMGDFNGDGQVDGSDVTILAGNWQYGVTASAASVPEPGCVSLLLCLIVTAFAFTVRRK